MHTLGTPELLDQNLPVNTIPGDSYALKFENHQFASLYPGT